jgi:hypothetical protein
VFRPAAHLFAVAIVLLALSATPGSAVASTNVNFGDISHKGLKKLGAGVDEPEALARDWDDRQPAGHRERREGGKQSVRLDLRAVSLAVDAPEEVRRVVVAAQGGGRGVQILWGDGDRRCDAPARERNDQHQARPAQKLFSTKWDLYATGQKNQAVALPVDKPKLVSGLKGQRRRRVGP